MILTKTPNLIGGQIVHFCLTPYSVLFCYLVGGKALYDRNSAFLSIITKMTLYIPLPKYLPTPPLSQLIKITGGYHAGRQCNYSDAKQRREHTYEATDVGNGAHISIANCGKRYGGPIQSIEKGTKCLLTGIWIYVWFDIEQYKCRNKDVQQSQH